VSDDVCLFTAKGFEVMMESVVDVLLRTMASRLFPQLDQEKNLTCLAAEVLAIVERPPNCFDRFSSL
jgi:hypothetical protein